MRINGVSQGVFAPTGRIIVFGQAGDDDIKVSKRIHLPAELHGDDGDDRLTGGSGSDILLGGAGNDHLIGRGNRDLLIGGTGADRLKGKSGSDILIAGPTLYDADPRALRAILAEWTRTDQGYLERIDHLRNGGGLNGDVTLTEETVFDDSARDKLNGGADQDWFFYAKHGPVVDKAPARHASEIVTPTNGPGADAPHLKPVVDWSGHSSKLVAAGPGSWHDAPRGSHGSWVRDFVLDLAAGDPNADIQLVIPASVQKKVPVA